MLVTGVDIIEIARVKDVAERHGERFLERDIYALARWHTAAVERPSWPAVLRPKRPS